jgi:hypothetical protein
MAEKAYRASLQAISLADIAHLILKDSSELHMSAIMNWIDKTATAFPVNSMR